MERFEDLGDEANQGILREELSPVSFLFRAKVG